MAIKYEIQKLKNAQGKGDERRFVRIYEQEPMTADELQTQIQDNCSLTKSDVVATLKALSELMKQELASGRRFYLPDIGYFKLSVDLSMSENTLTDKIRADNISVRNIKFRPNSVMLRHVKTKARFERSCSATISRQYTEEELQTRLRAYLNTHACLTRRDLERDFGLRQGMALKWLRHFTETGILRKEGVRTAPVYFLRE